MSEEKQNNGGRRTRGKDKKPRRMSTASLANLDPRGSIANGDTERNKEIARCVGNLSKYLGRKPPVSDEQCAERINEYFRDCQTNHMTPTVEGMSLAIGVVRKTVWEWENGVNCTPTKRDIIRQAKEILSALDAELVANNKIPQVVYIFRAKNYYGMSDQQEITVNTGCQGEKELDAEGIAKRYLSDGKTIETTFVDSPQNDN